MESIQNGAETMCKLDITLEPCGVDAALVSRWAGVIATTPDARFGETQPWWETRSLLTLVGPISANETQGASPTAVSIPLNIQLTAYIEVVAIE